ncbi:MAG TPA: hypothetical protein VMF69_19705 [Gemmataceae bacterium]|nr:hypothetical protein [Gemmataceae bacterium]
MASAPASHPHAQSPEEKKVSRTRAIDGLLVLSICGLAFLLASTPARNSDLWLHLASGRLLSAAGLPDGTDPFASTTEGVFWVNHTWLSDVLLYQIYRLGGGTALVIIKAILTALLAALWCCFRRRGEDMGLLALAGFAALLAPGPRLSLQLPSLLSLLGLLLTLYLLERPSLLEGASAERARAGRWLLLPLFALWANLDSWFVLGPVLVGLYAVGELLCPMKMKSEEKERHARSSLLTPRSSLLILFCAGLAACLATPYHYRIFAWPTPLGLTHAEQALRDDPLGQTLLFSPFGARFAGSLVFRSPAAWAYYFLLGAGAVSFVLSRRTLHPGRLLVWLGLASLSIYQARTIPFFAAAAAPLLALNVQEWASRRPSFHRSLAFSARRLGALVGVVLLVLAWPGWLQPAPYLPRGWTVEPDESLLLLTERLKRWHSEDRLRPDRFALTFSPDVAHYLAWFCPEEKGFVDSRWPLFDRVAGAYASMRRCLLQEGGADSGPELLSLLDAHRVDRILLHDADWESMSRAYRHLFPATTQWELLAVEGGATVFRRRGEPAPFVKAFDYQRAAYHPDSDQCVPPPLRPPQEPDLFDAFRHTRRARSADREEAALHILSFDVQAKNLDLSWFRTQLIGLIGCGSTMDPTATATALAAHFSFAPPLPTPPSEPLLLAVRAARRALAADPDDAPALQLLGQAYFRLDRQTREANWKTALPVLSDLRRVQMVTALEQAVLLRPDLDQAHDKLAQLYFERNQMFEQAQGDRCLEHLRARLRIAEQPDKRAALQSDVDRMEDLVNNSRKVYQANVVGKTDPSKVLMRAQLAARYGLSRLALEMMLDSHSAIFGKVGMEYELDLMLQAGRSYEVRDSLKPEHERQLDFFKYHWVKAFAAASCGDYEEADAELDKIDEPKRWIGLAPNLAVPVRSAIAIRVVQALLNRPLEGEGAAGRASALFLQFHALDPLEALPPVMRQEADQRVLRGLVALEAGAVETARRHFRTALDLWGSASAAASGGGQDFPARPIAQEMLRRMGE